MIFVTMLIHSTNPTPVIPKQRPHIDLIKGRLKGGKKIAPDPINKAETLPLPTSSACAFVLILRENPGMRQEKLF